MLESLHLLLQRPWWSRLLTGQPSVSLEVHHSDDGSAARGWFAMSIPAGTEASVQAVLRAAYPNCRLRALEGPYEPPPVLVRAAQEAPVHPAGEDARALRAAPRAAGGPPADGDGELWRGVAGAARDHPRARPVSGPGPPAARRAPGPRPGPGRRRRQTPRPGGRRGAARRYGPRARAPVPARPEGRLGEQERMPADRLRAPGRGRGEPTRRAAGPCAERRRRPGARRRIQRGERGPLAVALAPDLRAQRDRLSVAPAELRVLDRSGAARQRAGGTGTSRDPSAAARDPARCATNTAPSRSRRSCASRTRRCPARSSRARRAISSPPSPRTSRASGAP